MKFFSKFPLLAVAAVFSLLSCVFAQADQVTAGSTVILSVTADGTAPFSYQWRKDGSNLVGSTGPTLTITNIQSPNAGNYSVLVSNAAGSTTSDISSITVGSANVAPSITTQPMSQSVTVGANVTFVAAATGTPAPTFQWKKGGVNISGATSGTLNLSNVQASATAIYTVVATNNTGSVTSAGAVLTVNAMSSVAIITGQPASQSATVGTDVTFTVASGNSGSTFQWKKNGVAISGATNAILVLRDIQTSAGGTYTVEVTSTSGSVTSEAALLSVVKTDAPVFIDQPVNETVAVGYGTIFRASTTGNPAPTYQWQKNGINISGATGDSYTIPAVATGNAGSYRVIATNPAGSATSTAAALTVIATSKKSTAAAADFNRDGNTDIIWQNQVNGDRFIYLMNGSKFLAGSSLGTVVLNWTIAATGDFNGDGQTDVIWQNSVTGQNYIYLMNGTTFLSGVDLGTIASEWVIAAAADFNGDGQTDLAWENRITGARYIYLMNGTTFGAGIDLGIVSLEWIIAGAADFNGDGYADLLWGNVATGEQKVQMMNGTAPGVSISLGTFYSYQIAGTGDFNSDGKPDILLTNLVTGERTIQLMNGLVTQGTISLGVVGSDWALNRPIPQRMPSDFNADGRSDVVWQNNATGERYVYLMNGVYFNSGFTLDLDAAREWKIAGTGDFNTDGQPDLVGQNLSTGERCIWLMSAGKVVSTVSLGVVQPLWSIVLAADMNSDGQPDLVWQNTTTGARSIYLMNGTTVSSIVDLDLSASADWTIAASADFDRDGNPDLVGQNLVSGARIIWLMKGTIVKGTTGLGTGSAAWSIAAAMDLNADGSPDVLWQNTVTGERYIYLMDGTIFSSAISLGVIPTAWSICR